jgi:hypothetical protein
VKREGVGANMRRDQSVPRWDTRDMFAGMIVVCCRGLCYSFPAPMHIEDYRRFRWWNFGRNGHIGLCILDNYYCISDLSPPSLRPSMDPSPFLQN